MDLDGRKKTRGGPSRWFYLLALAPAVLGMVAMVFIITTQITRLGEGLEQMVVPGERELQLEPGLHTIFWEPRSVVEGKLYATDQISGLTFQVQAEDGRPVEVWPTIGSSTYTLYGREGRSVGEFRIDQGGLYRVSADYDEEGGAQAVIAVGNGFMSALFASIFGALGSFFGGGLLSILVVFLVHQTRSKAKREAAAGGR